MPQFTQKKIKYNGYTYQECNISLLKMFFVEVTKHYKYLKIIILGGRNKYLKYIAACNFIRFFSMICQCIGTHLYELFYLLYM